MAEQNKGQERPELTREDIERKLSIAERERGDTMLDLTLTRLEAHKLATKIAALEATHRAWVGVQESLVRQYNNLFPLGYPPVPTLAECKAKYELLTGIPWLEDNDSPKGGDA